MRRHGREAGTSGRSVRPTEPVCAGTTGIHRRAGRRPMRLDAGDRTPEETAVVAIVPRRARGPAGGSVGAARARTADQGFHGATAHRPIGVADRLQPDSRHRPGIGARAEARCALDARLRDQSDRAAGTVRSIPAARRPRDRGASVDPDSRAAARREPAGHEPPGDARGTELTGFPDREPRPARSGRRSPAEVPRPGSRLASCRPFEAEGAGGRGWLGPSPRAPAPGQAGVRGGAARSRPRVEALERSHGRVGATPPSGEGPFHATRRHPAGGVGLASPGSSFPVPGPAPGSAAAVRPVPALSPRPRVRLGAHARGPLVPNGRA